VEGIAASLVSRPKDAHSLLLRNTMCKLFHSNHVVLFVLRLLRERRTAREPKHSSRGVDSFTLSANKLGHGICSKPYWKTHSFSGVTIREADCAVVPQGRAGNPGVSSTNNPPKARPPLAMTEYLGLSCPPRQSAKDLPAFFLEGRSARVVYFRTQACRFLVSSFQNNTHALRMGLEVHQCQVWMPATYTM